MRSLRAYLTVRDAGGEWTTSAYRDLEPLLGALVQARSAGDSGVAIHVGFWRPDTAQVVPLLEAYPGLLLLSDAARYALPGPVDLSSNHVAEIEGLRFWLVLSGYGYEVDDPTIEKDVGDKDELEDETDLRTAPVHEIGAPGGAQAPRGWVERLAELDSDLAVQVSRVGIWDEVSYQQAESKLEYDARQRVGLARFLVMTGAEPKADNLLDRLRHCPPWFVSMPLERLRLTVRQANVFRAHGLSVVEDLVAGGTNGLLQLPNMGRKSINELSVALYQALLDGPPRGHRQAGEGSVEATSEVLGQGELGVVKESSPAASVLHSFRDELISAAQFLSANVRGVLAARMGFKCRRMTLQEIADDIGVTRERVRQIESSTCKKLARAGVWQHLEQRLGKLLQHREAPLLLDGLPGLDPWFEGLPDLAEPFDFIFERFLGRRFSVLTIDGVRYVSQISWAEWESELRAARRMLEASVADRMTESEARSLVVSLLIGRGEELRGEFWAKAAEFARFAEGDDGRRRLVAYGRSAEAVVHAILAGSPVPLHYSEIQRLSATYADEPLDIRRAHTAAANIGIQYDRGTYGLLEHCPLTEQELAQVCAEVEDMALEAHAQRQWHCAELCESLVQRGLGFGGRLTDYVVNLALKDSSVLVALGRLVWGLKDSWKAGASSRIDLRQAVISVLQRAGGPLTTLEIRRELEEERGVGGHFQVIPIAPLVRLGEGRWGLVGRDTGVDEAGLVELAATLKNRLNQLGRGIHASEVTRELEVGCGLKLDEHFDPQWLLTVCKDVGIRIDRGQYYYASEWEGSRRLTVSEAVDAALRSLDLEHGVSLDDVCATTVDLLDRPCSKVTISSALQSTEAEFDADAGLWRRANPQAATQDTE